jgi:replicative DNA helicase
MAYPKRRTKKPLTVLDYGGHLPPQNQDMEVAVLGAIMSSGKYIDKIMSDFNRTLFFNEQNALICDAIIDLQKESKPIDAITIISKLRQNNTIDRVGGMIYVMDIISKVSSAANLEYYIRILQQEALKRKIITVCSESIQKTFDNGTDVFDVYQNLQKELDTSIKEVVKFEVTKIGAVHEKILVDATRFAEEGIKSGVTSGLIRLDNVTNGWQKSDLIILAGRPSMGKELKNESMICTPKGFCRIDELSVGDKVMGSNGKSCNVIGVFPQGQKDIYRIHFDDNTFVDSGLEHQWEVSTRSIRKSKNKKSIVLTTRDMFSSYKCIDGRNNYCVRLCKPIQFEDKPIFLNPYVLGVFLGDGCSSKITSSVSNTENDVLKRFSENLPKGLMFSTNSNKIDFRIIKTDKKQEISFHNCLDSLGLKNKKSHEKFIPKEYLYNSISVRESLLQGLVDTDGFITTSGRNAIEYSTTSHQLCMDILSLVRGLGGKATYQVKQGSYTADKKLHKVKTYYRMYLSLPPEIMPISSQKHLKKYKNSKKYHSKFITRIESLNEKCEMTCISVDAEDCLYIVGDGYTLTHNTSMAISLMIKPAIVDKKAIAIFSLEMSREQLVARMQSDLSEINVSKIVKKQLTLQEIYQISSKSEALETADIFIDDTPSISLLEMKGKVRKLVKESNVELVIVDYLQLMKSGLDIQNREQEIAEISRGLKGLAKELDIPIIALSQLSRAVESRGGDKKPMLSDLRESGQIEQDADMILFCYRPEYYGIDSYEIDGNVFESHGLFMLLISKHRNGELGEIPLKFIHQFTKITNHDYDVEQSEAKAESERQNNETEKPELVEPQQEKPSGISFYELGLREGVKNDDTPF